MSLREKITAAQTKRKEKLDAAESLLNKAKEVGEGLTAEQETEITNLTSEADLSAKEIDALVAQEQRSIAAGDGSWTGSKRLQ